LVMSSKKNIRFIINPISGIRSKKNIPKLIEQHLNKNLFNYDIAHTESAAHAKELLKEGVALKKDAIIAVGGDGTLSLIASELIHTNIPMGIIPLGSGNGFARSLNIPLKTESAIQLLNSYNTVQIDTGSANNIPFINVCGFGFDAHVSAKFASAGTRGLQTYAKISLQELRNYQIQEYKIIIENESKQISAFIMAICNGPQYGNNAFIAPLAEFNDGLFDLTVLKDVTWKNMLGISTDLFLRTLHKSKSTTSYKLKETTVIMPSEAYVNIDGEAIWFEPKIDIKMYPKSLKIIVPKHE